MHLAVLVVQVQGRSGVIDRRVLARLDDQAQMLQSQGSQPPRAGGSALGKTPHQRGVVRCVSDPLLRMLQLQYLCRAGDFAQCSSSCNGRRQCQTYLVWLDDSLLACQLPCCMSSRLMADKTTTPLFNKASCAERLFRHTSVCTAVQTTHRQSRALLRC